jgi:hypothetical protein
MIGEDDSRVARIRRKFIGLQEALASPDSQARTVEGARRLWGDPPLSEQHVADFEDEIRVSLPEPYRAYRRSIADGGAGPYYGIFPLRKGEYFDHGYESWLDEMACGLRRDWYGHYGVVDPERLLLTLTNTALALNDPHPYPANIARWSLGVGQDGLRP